MEKITKRSYYMDDALDCAKDPKRMAQRIRERIPEGVEFDTIVGSGLSGILVVPGLALELGVLWGVVRKEHELRGGASHAESLYEGDMGRKWILIDDFMCTGATVRRVIGSVHAVFRATDEWQLQWDTEFIGLCEYDPNRAAPWRSVDYLKGAMFNSLRGVENMISTARPSTVVPEVEPPPAGHLGVGPSTPTPAPLVPCSPSLVW